MRVPRPIDAGEQIEAFFGREIGDVGSQLAGDHVDVLLGKEAEMIKRADQIHQIARRVVWQAAMDFVAQNRNHILLEIASGELHTARIAKQKA